LDLTGVSIFLLYYSKLYDKETTYDYAFSLLEQTLISYQSKVTPPSLAKTGWLLLNLDKTGLPFCIQAQCQVALSQHVILYTFGKTCH
jgi:hypothetical protein